MVGVTVSVEATAGPTLPSPWAGFDDAEDEASLTPRDCSRGEDRNDGVVSLERWTPLGAVSAADDVSVSQAISVRSRGRTTRLVMDTRVMLLVDS